MANVNNRGKFMRISVGLLDMIDYSKPYEMQLALTLLYKGSATYFMWEDSLVETTPTMLVQTFGNYDSINARQLANVVDSLTDLRDRGLISFNGDIKPKDFIRIDTKQLIKLSQQQGSYIELTTNDFYRIMQTDNKIIVNNKEVAINGIESLLLQAFLLIKARWNFKTIDMLAQVDDFSYAINSDEEVQQAKGVFCSDTLDFIRTHKHYQLDEIESWCDDRYLSGYLGKLEEIGCIKIYSRKMKAEGGIAKTRKFYYTPTMKFECIDAMVRQYARRNNYVIKEQEEPTEPKQVVPQKHIDDWSKRRRDRYRAIQ